MTWHRDVIDDDIHALPARTYADIAARDADTAFHSVATNVNKKVRVNSPLSYYWLTSIVPGWQIDGSSTVATFLHLSDTPANYTGAAGKVAQVNAAGNAIEFGQALRTTDAPEFARLGVGGPAVGGTPLAITGDAQGDAIDMFSVVGSTIAPRLRLYEARNNGFNAISISTPDALATDYRMVLPASPVVANNQIFGVNVTSGVATLVITDSPTIGGNLTVAGDLTVQGTTTTLDTATLLVEDKNIEMGVVPSPNDITADGGGITLKGSTDKTITWLNATDDWNFNQHVTLTPVGLNQTSELRFKERLSSGTNHVSLKADLNLGSDINIVLPTNVSSPGIGFVTVFPFGADEKLAFDHNPVIDGSISFRPTSANAVRLFPFGNTAGQTSEIRFVELVTNGINYVGFKGPDAIAADVIFTLPDADGAAGQALVTDGSGVLSWGSAGAGDVTGPASSTANALARFNGATGKIIKNSVGTLSDVGNLAGLLSVGASVLSGQTFDVAPQGAGAGQTGKILFSELTANGSNLTSLQAADSMAVNIAYTLPAAPPLAGQVLSSNASGVMSWTTAASGTGDVVGPASAFDNRVARFDLNTGKLIQSSLVSITDAGGMFGVSEIDINSSSTFAIQIRPHGTLAGQTGELRFRELAANGTDRVAIKAPDSLTSSYTLTLPINAGSANSVLQSNGGGVLSWSSTPLSDYMVGAATSVIGELVAFGTTDGKGAAESGVFVLAGGINDLAYLTVDPSAARAIDIKPFGSSAGNTGELQFLELAANGTNYVGFRAPDAITTSIAWRLPAADGAANTVLVTDGAGNLSFSAVAGAGDVVGPASSVDNDITLFNGATGKSIKRSANLSYEVGKVIRNANGGIGTRGPLIVEAASLRASNTNNLENTLSRYQKGNMYAYPVNMGAVNFANADAEFVTSDGVFQFKAAKSPTGWNNLFYSLQAVDRVPGRTLEVLVDTSRFPDPYPTAPATEGVFFGWGQNTYSGASFSSFRHGFFMPLTTTTTGRIDVYENGAFLGNVVPTIGVNDCVRFRIVLRTAGADYYVKIGAGRWSLVFRSTSITTSPLHPGVTVSDGEYTLSEMSVYDQEIEGTTMFPRTALAATGVLDNTTIIGMTDMSADRTVTIDSVQIAMADQIFIIKDESGAASNQNRLTVATEGSQTIDGQPSIDISDPYGVLRLYTDGSNLFSW